MKNKILKHIKKWELQGYKNGISDEVPIPLMQNNLAPSYKSICIAILKNDINLLSLGYSKPKNELYGIYKRIEIAKRKIN